MRCRARSRSAARLRASCSRGTTSEDAVTRALATLAATVLRLYARTLRVTILLADGSTCGLAGAVPIETPVLAAVERDAIALAGIFVGRPVTVLIAYGRDGDWATRIVEALGFGVVRGSNRRGGARGLLRLIGDQRRAPGSSVLLTVDGPLGPAGVAKPGVALLA